MKTATEQGVELRPLEVTVSEGEAVARSDDADETEMVFGECPECESDVGVLAVVRAGSYYDGVFEALRRRGIDIGRPFLIHVDQVTRTVTAKQKPWSPE